MKSFAGLICALAILLPVGNATGQTSAENGSNIVQSVLTGEFGPALLRQIELPKGTVPVALTLIGGASLGETGVANLNSKLFELTAEEKSSFKQYLGCFWTTGRSVHRGGSEFVVGYRPVLEKPDFGPMLLALGSECIDPEPQPTPAQWTHFELVLINVSQIGSLSPRTELDTVEGFVHIGVHRVPATKSAVVPKSPKRV